MDAGIIPSVMGGLGNQMFITAAAFVVSKIQNCPLYILYNPKEQNTHNHLNYNYNKSIFKFFGEHFDIPITNVPAILGFGYKIYRHNDCFTPWNPHAISPGTLMMSYYQYYPPLQPFEHELRELFIRGLEEFRNKVLTKCGSLENCAFLHVRRGDTHKALSVYYLVGIDYFIEATKLLLEKKPNLRKIYIVSDEYEWVKEQDLFKQDIFEIYETSDELETMALMSLCTEGAICGGQTFGWWGAFLGSHSKRNPVFYPKNWIKLKVWDLLPKEWIVISNNVS
jgi:hypothetical protein